MFATRAAAGRALANQLEPDADRALQVFAVSREGIAVGVHVAAALGADIDLICARYSAIAVVIEGCRPYVELDRVIELGLHAADVSAELEDLQRQLDRALEVFRGQRPFPHVYDRHVILVDDGVTPTRVLLTAAKWLRALGVGRTTVALPACPEAALDALSTVANDVICLEEADRRGVMFSYADADPVGELEALTLLGRSRLAASRVRFSTRTITRDMT
jgi:putative phosphoribosyl transferase